MSSICFEALFHVFRSRRRRRRVYEPTPTILAYVCRQGRCATSCVEEVGNRKLERTSFFPRKMVVFLSARQTLQHVQYLPRVSQLTNQIWGLMGDKAMKRLPVNTHRECKSLCVKYQSEMNSACRLRVSLVPWYACALGTKSVSFSTQPHTHLISRA